jgi:outer membrane murein-binding lipoprotein Lpp
MRFVLVLIALVLAGCGGESNDSKMDRIADEMDDVAREVGDVADAVGEVVEESKDEILSTKSTHEV